jgi:hypothetical protein
MSDIRHSANARTHLIETAGYLISVNDRLPIDKSVISLKKAILCAIEISNEQ